MNRIEEIIRKIVCFGYDSLTESEKHLFDEYEAALEYDARCDND